MKKIASYIPVCLACLFVLYPVYARHAHGVDIDSVSEVVTRVHAGHPLIAKISRPQGKGPHPVIMAIHGGGFQGGDRHRFKPSLHRHFNAMGFAVMSAEYRLTTNGEGGEHPRAVQDCLHNLFWMMDHADSLRFDPDRIFLLGSSAGAYLAMMTALTCASDLYRPDFGPYRHQKAKVLGVISNSAMYGWTAIIHGENYVRYLREHPAVSPVNLAHLGGCMHFLLLGGDHDLSWSPPRSARLMAERLKAHGKNVMLHLREEQTHPALYETGDPYVDWALPWIDAFLRRVCVKDNP